MDKSITIKIKTVYGNTTYYPVCKDALVFARLVEQKTLTSYQLNRIKELGYDIKVQAEELKI